MQLRRAMEIVNDKSNDNVVVYYNENPVKIISVDNNIGTAYVSSLDQSNKFEVDLEQLIEKNKYV